MGEQARQRRMRRETAGGDGAGPPGRRPWLWVVGIAALLSGLAAFFFLRHAVSPVAKPTAAPPAPIRIAEREPNGTPAQAQSIEGVPAEITGELGPGDQDVYRLVTAESQGYLLDARVEGLAGARLTVSAADATHVAAAPPRIGALGIVHGTTLLTVDGPGGVSGAYRLYVDRRPWVKGLDWEPDDDPAHAQELAPRPHDVKELGAFHASGWWSRPGDVDCFRLPLTVPGAGAVVRVELSPPRGTAGRVRVLDAGEPEAKTPVPPRLLVEATAARDAKVVLPAVGARAWMSAYFLCASAAEGENLADSYVLEVRTFTPPGPFEFEPNDVREAASALPRGVAVGGHLTRGDVDWFRISAGPPGALAAIAEIPPGVTAELSATDEAGRELVLKTGAPGAVVALPRMVGAAFVRLRAVAGENLTAPYRLTVSHAVGDGGT
jgi:hypothetical protein